MRKSYIDKKQEINVGGYFSGRKNHICKSPSIYLGIKNTSGYRSRRVKGRKLEDTEVGQVNLELNLQALVGISI